MFKFSILLPDMEKCFKESLDTVNANLKNRLKKKQT